MHVRSMCPIAMRWHLAVARQASLCYRPRGWHGERSEVVPVVGVMGIYRAASRPTTSDGNEFIESDDRDLVSVLAALMIE